MRNSLLTRIYLGSLTTLAFYGVFLTLNTWGSIENKVLIKCLGLGLLMGICFEIINPYILRTVFKNKNHSSE